MSTCQGTEELGAWGTGMGTGRAWHCMVLADLPGSQCHFGVLGLAELCQLMEDGGQLICQRGVTATQLVLQCHITMAKLRLLEVQDGLIPNSRLTGDGFILHLQSHAAKGDKTQSSKMGHL